MMIDKLVSKSVAKLAKSKGFNWTCEWVWDSDGAFSYGLHTVFCTTYPMSYRNLSGKRYENVYARPTQTALNKWLREKHAIFINVMVDCTTEPKFAYEIHQFVGNAMDLASEEWYWKEGVNGEYLERTYELAMEAGLTEALKLIE